MKRVPVLNTFLNRPVGTPGSAGMSEKRALELFIKLSTYLAISRSERLVHFSSWGEYVEDWHGLASFVELPNAHGQEMHRVRWMPHLESGDYRRLTFAEFCDYYDLSLR
jgi:hypothetical protein